MKKISPAILVRQTAATLADTYRDHALATQHAWWLVEKLIQLSKSTLLTQQEIALTQEQEQQLAVWLDEITLKHKPIQYILGSVPFLDLEIMVESPILIPRPETEEWVAALCSRLQKLKTTAIKIADIGTGTGCIALALAKALPKSHIIAIDINPQALDLAQRNATRNTISNVEFIQSNLFEHMSGTFDIIISNPPYISEEEFVTLDAGVATWEDKHALVAHDDGLDLIKKIITQAPHHLHTNKELDAHSIPNVCIEIGYQQGPCVAELMKQAGYHKVTIHKDLHNNDRVVEGSVGNVAQKTTATSIGKHTP